MSRSASKFHVLLVFATIVIQIQWASVAGMYCDDLTPTLERPHSASVTDFGAVGDGITLNTKAFQNAIFYLNSFAKKGGAQLFVPAGRWLTGSFSLISHLTLSLDKDAVILGSTDSSDWPVVDPLPSYGRGRELPGKRHQSLIFGSNLTDVIITGANGTIDGQGAIWWDWFHNHTLNYTRPPLVELMYSTRIVISNLTFKNSPFWNIHPVYCSQVLVQHLTILAPISSPNTDGIDPDSSTNVCIEDCYIRNGDDIVVIKSGWDEYGISFGHPSSNISIRNITGQTRNSAGIAFGSEMSGGISNVRAEGIRIVNSVHGIRIKTAPGRGGYVRNVYIADVSMDNVSIAIRITGNYGEHPDDNYDKNALPIISNITIKDVVGVNIGVAGLLQGIQGDNFSNICISNVSLSARSMNPWNCSLVEGYSNSVSPEICEQLRPNLGSGQVCYDGNSYPAATIQPQAPQKSGASRLIANLILLNLPAGMGQHLVVASTSTEHFGHRPATCDFDSKALFLRSGGTSDGSTLSSSATGSSYPLSSASWSSGAAGLDALQAEDVTEIAERMVQDGRLSAVVKEFGDSGGDSALEKWFIMLDVEWVLNMKELSSQCTEWTLVRSLSWRWIRGFTVMVRAFAMRLMALSNDDDEVRRTASEAGNEVLFAGFVKASILKILPFVDVVITAVNRMPENLPSALGVYAYISGAPSSHGAAARMILMDYLVHALLRRRRDQESSAAQEGVVAAYGTARADLDSRREELVTAIQSVLKKTLDRFPVDNIINAGDTWAAPQGSEVHAATCNAVDFIRLLSSNKALINSLTIHSDDYPSVDRMLNIVSLGWEQLLKRLAMSLPDAALRSIFLINNYNAMAEALPEAGHSFLERETGDNLKLYLDVAWGPVISPLLKPGAARHRTEQVTDFMALFLATYRTQKLWRVVSPVRAQGKAAESCY
ncbi:hypothetical protein EJB05_13275 [Eragrostis curvula]|uniref:Exocyst complex subunit Exo70 C-terminal domain-containing protein n=1 Tax=Eragrostis curvula TaxID=38414 RepID=A0A5J9VWX4_9POAL|nr:hypothetical protein EJB05_13275 [Eragrostis curvula]